MVEGTQSLIGINGMGRIGRAVARVMLKRGQPFVASDQNDPKTIAYLLRHDTIYGSLSAVPPVVSGPVMWGAQGVKVVIDCSGNYGDVVGHLARGARVVIISAPMPADTVLLYGVNHQRFDPGKHWIISMASCTMNCVATVVKLIRQDYQIKYLNLVSLNAYTNNQRLVDAPHSDNRLARAAAQNIIPSESSTGQTIDQIFPELTGKYSALAFRVPIACGSVSHLSLQLDRPSNSETINRLLKAGAESQMHDIVEYSEEPLVSSDIIGNPHSAVIDGLCTQVNGNNVHLVTWYDNEFGYANRLVDLATYILFTKPTEIVISIDRDGVLAWGGPPGPISAGDLIALQSKGHIIGTGGGAPGPEQEAQWKLHGVHPAFALSKGDLPSLKGQYPNATLIHVDNEAVVVPGFRIISPEELRMELLK